nr:unnamed protein product [Spirometra erinaceieuropaei]
MRFLAGVGFWMAINVIAHALYQQTGDITVIKTPTLSRKRTTSISGTLLDVKICFLHDPFRDLLRTKLL